jgi:hypothetical protein
LCGQSGQPSYPTCSLRDTHINSITQGTLITGQIQDISLEERPKPKFTGQRINDVNKNYKQTGSEELAF